MGVDPSNGLTDFLNLPTRQRLPPGIPSAALDKNRLDRRVCRRFLNGRQIGQPLCQGNLAKFDVVIGKGTPCFAPLTGDSLQRVIHIACGRKKHVARGDAGKHSRREGVRAVDKIMPHQGLFRSKNLGVNQFQLVAAQVVVAVAGGPGKAGVADPIGGKRLQNLGGVSGRYFLNFGKLPANFLFGLPGQLQKSGRKIKFAHRAVLAACASRAAACSASRMEIISAGLWIYRPGMLTQPAGTPPRLTNIAKVSVPPAKSTSS